MDKKKLDLLFKVRALRDKTVPLHPVWEVLQAQGRTPGAPGDES